MGLLKPLNTREGGRETGGREWEDDRVDERKTRREMAGAARVR